MFEDFKRNTKELFFDELDEKFRDFEQAMEGLTKMDQVMNRLKLLEQQREEVKTGDTIEITDLGNVDRYEDPAHNIKAVSSQVIELRAKVAQIEQDLQEQKSRARQEQGRIQTLKSETKV